MASNVDILTRSHTVLKAKARAKKNQIDSIVFDDTARHEYLTGFRKRNLEKRQAAKEKAKERDRLEHLQARKEHRQALQERAIENAEMVESAFRKKIDGSDDENDNTEFRGFSTFGKGKGKAIQEYEDEEQLATVTVIEEFDPNSLRDMPSTSQGSSRSESEPHAPLDLAEVRRKGRQRFTSHPGSGGTSRHGRVHAGTANTLAEKLPPKKDFK
ncbi:hypothetical protein EW145_g4908 [Phellinidium pouzarii]|uniref:Ribosomal RNA-processing protein 17 n=1 Tax=Phellinidium pouzarii TaxID=167371 RepID=A0A4S4L217_9AGAM|nr:hypothetical protein EW145_g4908 [Phellinidium pouzarii]